MLRSILALTQIRVPHAKGFTMATLSPPGHAGILSRIPIKLSITLFVGFVCLSLTALDLQQIFSSRTAIIHTAGLETENLARSLALQAEGVFGTADAVLTGLNERVSVDGVSPAALARMEHLMRLRVAVEPRIHGLFLIDEHGHWLANSLPGTPRNLNYADRDFFRYLRDHDTGEPFITAPLQSKSDNSWIIILARRINHPDGRFAGVLTATISTDLFQRFYDKFDVGAQGSITLTNDAGRLLVRHPFVAANVGLDVSQGELFIRSRGAERSDSFQFHSMIDDAQRMGSFDKVRKYHLLVVVTKQVDEVLAVWQHSARVDLCWLAIVIAAVTALGYYLAAQLAERAKAEAQYRLLADNASDAIICVDSEGQRSYVSPSFLAMTGFTEEQLEDRPRHALIASEDHLIVDSLLNALDIGEASQPCRYRQYLCTGETIWVEMRARAARARRGDMLDYVLNIRDISQQKLAEDELAEANAELSAMTLNDALTGIANRRNFDQTMRREWNRAMRNGRPLALLMIDADHFKAYNDRYGHLLGDDCLKSIASVLAGAVRRAGDLVARYGGEEFAAILPDLPADKAAIVAERMRAAVLESVIAHEGNDGGVVSVSIGVASMVPGRGSESKSLLKLADEALYRAKHDGRNRVTVLEPIREVPRIVAAE